MPRRNLRDTFFYESQLVKVIKPFDSCREPCPKIGTFGTTTKVDDDFITVKFPLPVTDSEGYLWEVHRDDEFYMRLKMKRDEIGKP